MCGGRNALRPELSPAIALLGAAGAGNVGRRTEILAQILLH